MAAGLVGGWPWWWALAALLVVYLYAHYAFASLVAHVTAMFPAFFAVAIGLGAPPLARRADVRVLLEPERGDHALRHRAGADRVRRRLPDAGRMVAHRLHDLAGAPGDLAADRLPLVEGDRPVVTSGNSNRHIAMQTLSRRGDSRRRHRQRSGAGGDPRARSGGGALRFRFEWEQFPWGSEYYFAHGRMMPADALDRAAAVRRDLLRRGRRSAAAGQRHAQRPAAADPARRSISTRACGRRSSTPACAARSSASRPGDIDFVVVRENTEGEYAQVGGVLYSGGAARGRDAVGDVHAPRHRAHHPLRVRSRAPPRTASAC